MFDVFPVFCYIVYCLTLTLDRARSLAPSKTNPHPHTRQDTGLNKRKFCLFEELLLFCPPFDNFSLVLRL